MPKYLQPKIKLIFIVGLIITTGIFFRISLERNFFEKPSGPLTPPINAKDEANKLIQRASENFFYHEFDQAIKNYKKAIALFETRKNFKRAARTYESIGDLYKFSNNLKEAEETYMFAINYQNKLNDKISAGRAMNKIADFYMEISRSDQAGEWFNKATLSVRDSEPHVVKAKIYETQGHYFIKNDRITEALESFHKAKDTYDKIGYPLGYDNISPMIKKLKRDQKKGSH